MKSSEFEKGFETGVRHVLDVLQIDDLVFLLRRLRETTLSHSEYEKCKKAISRLEGSRC